MEFERAGRFSERGAGGRDVIKENDIFPRDRTLPCDREAAKNVLPPLRDVSGLGLGFCVPDPRKNVGFHFDR